MNPPPNAATDSPMLPIIEPQLAQVVAGFVVAHGKAPLAADCLLLGTGGACCAFRVDPAIRLHPADWVELRAVVLETQDAPVWEVWVRGMGAEFFLVPGQHCTPRTAPAEQWLKEIQTGVLSELTAQAARLHTELLGHETAHQAINPTSQAELLYVTALATARQELLSPDYAHVCRAAQAAERLTAQAAAMLRRHRLVGEDSDSRLALWNWIVQWRERRQLRQHVKTAQNYHRDAEEQRRQLERGANSPDLIARIEQRAQELLRADRSHRQQWAPLKRAERRATLQVSEAQKLVHYLQQRRGLPVTLEQSLVKGRAHTLPTIPNSAKVQAHLRGQAAKVAPSVATDPSLTSAAGSADQRPAMTAEAPKVKHPSSPRPTPAAPSKSNGFGMKA